MLFLRAIFLVVLLTTSSEKLVILLQASQLSVVFGHVIEAASVDALKGVLQ